MFSNAKQNHPECGDDEVFFSNANDERYACMEWKTKRKGNVAYRGSGEEVGDYWPGAFPVFVKKSEILAKDPEVLRWLLGEEEN